MVIARSWLKWCCVAIFFSSVLSRLSFFGPSLFSTLSEGKKGKKFNERRHWFWEALHWRVLPKMSGNATIEAKWRADEEKRMKAMGLSSSDVDPWDTKSAQLDEEKKDETHSSGPVTIDLEEVQRKAREEAAAQIAAAEKVCLGKIE